MQVMKYVSCEFYTSNLCIYLVIQGLFNDAEFWYYMILNGMVICEQWLEKCMELAVVSLDVLSWNLPDGTEKRTSFPQDNLCSSEDSS
jgi:hypothetical protein